MVIDKLLKLLKRQMDKKEKELKISNNAINKYQELCMYSTYKCNGDTELLKYKIRRAVELGMLQDIRKNGTKVIGYYNRNFIVNNNEVVDITRKQYKGEKRIDRYVFIDGQLKRKHKRFYRQSLKAQKI